MRYSILGAALAASVASAQSSSAASASGSMMSMSGSMSASASAASASASGSASGNSSYIMNVLQALQMYNLTTLAGAAEAVYNTSNGMALLSGLSQGNWTVFAPTNNAFMTSNYSSMLNNTNFVAELLSYHIVNQTWTMNNTMVTPNHTIARTALNGGNYTLPGNFSAPVVLTLASSNATNLTVVEAMDNVTSVAGTMAGNLMIYIIDSVLTLPMTISQVAMNLFPSLAGVIQQAGLLQPLEMATGITVFAPSNAAIQAVMSAVGQLNSTQLQTVLANHVINGTVVYSPDLTSQNWTSAAGEPIMVMQNSTGMFVMSGNSTAMITQSDIILTNGVAYVIDQVLVNTMSNATAAAGAYSSAMASPTDNSSPATSSAAASGSKAAAGLVAPIRWTNSLIGGALAFAGVVLGGGYILA